MADDGLGEGLTDAALDQIDHVAGSDPVGIIEGVTVHDLTREIRRLRREYESIKAALMDNADVGKDGCPAGWGLIDG